MPTLDEMLAAEESERRARAKSTEGVTQLGVAALLKERPDLAEGELTEGQKLLGRIFVEGGLGLLGVAAPIPGSKAAAVPRLAKAGKATAELASRAKKIARFSPSDVAAQNLAATSKEAAKQAAKELRRGRVTEAARHAPGIAAGETLGAKVSESFDPSPPGEANIRALGTGAVGAAAEFLTVPAAAARLFERLRRGGFGLEPEARQAVVEILQAGGKVSPGLFSTARWIDIVEEVSSGSLLGGGSVLLARESGADIQQAIARRFVQAFGTVGGREAVEDLVREAFGRGVDIFRLAGKKMYQEVDRLTQGATVDITDLVKGLTVASEEFGNQGARKLLREVRKFVKPGKSATQVGTGIFDEAGNEILKDVAAVAPDNRVSFAVAADIRSKLLSIGRVDGELIAGETARIGKRFSKLVDRAMDKTARGLKGKAHEAWREASRFWKRGSKVWNSRLIKALSKDEPRALLPALRNNTRNIKKLRGELTEAEFENVKGLMISDIATRASDESGQIVGRRMLKQMQNQQEGLVEMLGFKGYRNMQKLFTRLELTQAKTAAEGVPGRMMIQLKQAGAVSQVGGVVIGTTTGIGAFPLFLVIGPEIAAKVMGKDAFVDWALLGLKPKAPPETILRAFTQMSALAVKEGATLTTSNPNDNRLRERPRVPHPVERVGQDPREEVLRPTFGAGLDPRQVTAGTLPERP